MSDADKKTTPIFNAILTFCMSCIVHATSNKLVELIINNFDNDEIKESKKVLCDNFDEQFKVRKTTELRNEKYVHAQDIVDILKKLDGNNKVTMNSFVIDSAGLLRLPKVNLEDLSPLSCMIKLNQIIDKMDYFSNAIESSNTLFSKHESRIELLEKSNSAEKRGDESATCSTSGISIVAELLEHDTVMPTAPPLPVEDSDSNVECVDKTNNQNSSDTSVVKDDSQKIAKPNSLPTNSKVDEAATTLSNTAARNKVEYATVIKRNNDQWEIPRRQKRNQKRREGSFRLRGEGTAENCPIKGAPEPARDLFVSRVVNTHTSDGLKSYLMDNGIQIIDLKQMSHDESRFKSFKVSVAKTSYTSMFNRSLWSSGVNVNRFREYQQKQ